MKKKKNWEGVYFFKSLDYLYVVVSGQKILRSFMPVVILDILDNGRRSCIIW